LQANGYRGSRWNQYKNEYGSIQKLCKLWELWELGLERAEPCSLSRDSSGHETNRASALPSSYSTRLAPSCISSRLASLTPGRPASHAAGLCLSLLCSYSGTLWPNHCLSKWNISLPSFSASYSYSKRKGLSNFDPTNSRVLSSSVFDEAPGTCVPPMSESSTNF
jgi:hypothetical protein